MSMTVKRLYEHSPGAIATLPTGSAPVVAGCKLLGLESKHNRRYTRESIEKAARLYEGVAVYIDHPDPTKPNAPRPFAAKFGVVRNVQVRADGLYGDLHYNPKHPMAQVFEGWVDTDPSAIGFSHDAHIRWRDAADGIEEVTEITRVNSVDLVATPATTKGIFESESPLDPLMTTEVAPQEDAAPEGPQGLDAALSALLAAILSDPVLDLKAKQQKVLIAMKLLDDVEPQSMFGEKAGDEEVEEGEEGGEEGDEKGKDFPPAKDDEDEDKEAEESVGRIMKGIEEKLGKLVNEAVNQAETRIKAIKSPVALPPAGAKSKSFTVDDLMNALSGNKN